MPSSSMALEKPSSVQAVGGVMGVEVITSALVLKAVITVPQKGSM